MAQDKKHILELHDEIKNWKSAVELIKEETSTLNKQLEDIASENNKEEVRAQIEHFQNQFIRQAEVNDILNHDLKQAEHRLAVLSAENPVASDHRLVDDDPNIRDEAETHIKLFTELKSEFNRFATEWL